MSNSYDTDTKLKSYFENYINQMNIDKRYTSVLVDIMMRRSYEYQLSPEEIRQDMIGLLKNLNEIFIDYMTKEYERSNGLYMSKEKKNYNSKKLFKTRR